MGSNKVEKTIKKMKKIKKRGRDLVDNGQSSEVADFSKCDAKVDATEMNEVDVPAVNVKARKSKKFRSNKKKDKALSNEESNVVNDTKKHEPTEEGRSKGKKDKSIKIHKEKALSNEESNVVNDTEKLEPSEEGCSKGKKDKSNKVHKNKRKRAVVSDEHSTEVNNGEEIEPVIDGSKHKKDKSKRARKNRTKEILLPSEQNTEVNDMKELQPEAKDSKEKKGKSKAQKQRKANHSTVTEAKSVQKVPEVVVVDVYQIPSGEDDDSKGMKKWIKEYHERRPGIKVLQAQIDDFITAYEEQEEQAKREKEASLAEDGWTVVGRRKGGKKTTDSESGITVGAVAEAAVREKLANKKNKDVGLDFYRFQRKEAHRSEIMKLQSKFEEDRKRIQQLRAARKFNPY